MEKIIEFAPIIVVIILFLIQNRLVVTPEQLEKKHREILDDVSKKYATQSIVNELKSQFHDMAEKIDKIYNILIDRQWNMPKKKCFYFGYNPSYDLG